MVTGNESLVTVDPVGKPKNLTPEQLQEIESKAEGIVKDLVRADGSEALSIEDRIGNIGIQDQKGVSSNMALLQEKMGKAFYSDGKTNASE